MLRKKVMIFYFISSLLIGIAIAAGRTAIIYQHYEFYHNEYMQDAKEPLQMLGYALIIAMIFAASAFFFIRKEKFSEVAASGSQVSIFASALLGFVFIALGILILVYYRDALFSKNSSSAFFVFQIVSYVLLFFSGFYFIINAAVQTPKRKAIFSFFPTLWALAFLITSYINPIYNYTDSNHNFGYVSFSALLIFFLFETKAAVTGKSTPIRFVLSLIALITSVSYILPIFILTAFWEYPLSIQVLFEAVECGAVFYIFSVLYSMIKAWKPQTKENET